MKSHPIRHIIQPWLVAVVILTYAIGIGIAFHLGTSLDWINLFLGLLGAISILETRNFLSAYFDHPETPVSTLHRDDSWYSELRAIKRQALMQIALTILTAWATTAVILIFRNAFSGACVLLYGFAFFLSIFSASPPLRLEKNGYGELIEALLVANFIPAIGLVLQDKPLSSFLIMLTLPLTLIYLAMKIAHSFESYGFQITHGSRTLVTQLGWQRSMRLHNLLIIAAYLLISIFGLVGLSWSSAWPMLLGLPLGGFQIFLIQRIEEGDKPRWRLLQLVAGGLFLLTAYFVLLTLWI